MPNSAGKAKGDEYIKDVYQVLVEHLMNERLDRIASQDKEFSAISEKLDEVLEQYHELELPEKTLE